MSSRTLIRGALACAVACALCLVVAAEAGAALSFESSASVATNMDSSLDLAAGSHPYALTSEFKLKAVTNSEGRLLPEGGELDNAITELPAGLTVDPLAVTRCEAQEFTTVNHGTGEDGCPNASAVGVVAMEYVNPSTLAERKTARYPLYDLVPSSGSPALFGFMAASGPVYLTPSLRTGGDYGVTLSAVGLPQGVRMLGSAVTLWGVPADSSHDAERGTCLQSHGSCPAGVPAKPLLALPTQCASDPRVVVRVSSWQEPEQYESSSSSLAGGSPALSSCQALDFSPALHVHLESSVADSPTGLTVEVHVPQSEDPSGLAEAHLQDAVVTLPAGLALNLSRAGNLAGCPLQGPEGIGLGSVEPAHCPQTSRVGGVTIGTPLLPTPLQGGLYLAQQGNLAGSGTNPFGSLLALYAVAEGSGVVLKLPVEVSADQQTGQLSMHLGADPATGQAHTPQLPFEDIAFEFDGGQQAALVTPATCGDDPLETSLTPWNGAAPATPSDQIHITEGCTKAFNPSFSTDTADKQGNGYSPLTIALTRKDGEQELRSVATTWPGGLLPNISHVALCPEPQASLGTCGPESLIGEAVLFVGAGAQPLAIGGGKVYLTGPYRDTPFGLSITLPAVAGPLNLGSEGHPIVVRAMDTVTRRTAQVTIATDASGPYAMPNVLQGIGLQVRSLEIVLNRPDFISNPSGCAPLTTEATITSAQGATSTVSSPFQSTNCQAVPFGPKFSASTFGKPSRKNGIGLDIKIVEGYPHEANAHYAKVELPRQLPARLTTLHKACLDSVFQLNPATCPSASVIGTATVVTSLLPVPLVGPTYLVSHGAEFPELVMVLQGYGITVEAHGETFIDKAGITSTTFPNIPEAPIPYFELRMPPGPESVLSTSGNLCAGSMRMVTTLVSYNGREVKEAPPIAVSGCPSSAKKPVRGLKVLRHTLRGRVLTLAVRVPGAGKLGARGPGLSAKAKHVAKAGVVKLKLWLSKHELRALSRKGKHGRRHQLLVRLTFAPRHGSGLSTSVRIAVR